MDFEMKPYWLVHGDGPTNHRHASHQAALSEAERLARQHPGTVFAVLQAVDAVRKVDIERVSLRLDGRGRNIDPNDDIPF